MALIDGIVSYWKLDEFSDGSAPVTREDSASSNDLSDTNNTPSAAGIISLGADFEASNSEYLSILDASQTGLDFGAGAFSISCWMKLEALSTLYRAINKQDGSLGYGYGITILSNNKVRFSANDSGVTQDIDSTGTITNTTNFWHIVVTRGAVNGIRIYINGSVDTTTSNGGANVSTSVPFAIGARVDSGPSGYMDGIIDEVGVWSRELTSDEVTELYNSGAGLTYPFTGPVNTTSGFFNFMPN